MTQFWRDCFEEFCRRLLRMTTGNVYADEIEKRMIRKCLGYLTGVLQEDL